MRSIRVYLAALAAGTESDEFVALAGRHIGFRRSQKVLLGKVAAFQDILQRFRRQRGGGCVVIADRMMGTILTTVAAR